MTTPTMPNSGLWETSVGSVEANASSPSGLGTWTASSEMPFDMPVFLSVCT
jgi:hypothetical protein